MAERPVAGEEELLLARREGEEGEGGGFSGEGEVEGDGMVGEVEEAVLSGGGEERGDWVGKRYDRRGGGGGGRRRR